MSLDNSSSVLTNRTFPNEGMVPMNLYEIHRIAAPELVYVDRIVTPMFYLIGLIGNPLSAKIWLSAKVRRSNSSAIYLGAIAVVDMVFLLLHVWMELLSAWGINTFNIPVLCKVYMVLQMTLQYLAPLLILGFTFERFIAVCFPFYKERYCTVRKAVICVNILTTVALVFGHFQAYFVEYSKIEGVCNIVVNMMDFYKVWTWISEMLIFLVVPLTVLVFNMLVIIEIRRINKFSSPFGKESGRGVNQTSTITLLSVSFYLICTLLPATIVYAMQLSIEAGDHTTPPSEWSKDVTWSSYLTYYHIRKIVEEICLSNYACYVFIYYITSGYFREEVQRIWCFSLLCSSKDVHGEKTNGSCPTMINEKGQTVMLDEQKTVNHV